MWLKGLPYNYHHCCSGYINLNGLWRDGNVFVMDNHRAAAWCWLQTCDRNKHYSFLHIDQHSDLLLDSCKGAWATYKIAIDNPQLSLDEYLELRHSDRGALAFRWDNYIRPIHGLLPDWFESAYFAYTQEFDIDDNDRRSASGEYMGFLGKAIRLTSIDLLELLKRIPKKTSNKWIINVDIDYFFANDIMAKGYSYLDEFAELLNACLPQAQVLTIALSPSCCNGKSISEGWKKAIQIFESLKKALPILNKCTYEYQ